MRKTETTRTFILIRNQRKGNESGMILCHGGPRGPWGNSVFEVLCFPLAEHQVMGVSMGLQEIAEQAI